MEPQQPVRAVCFDLFGTLVAVDRPDDPAAAVGAELAERGLAVPDDWRAAYGEAHVDVEPGAELPLADHVAAALASCRADLAPGDVRGAAREVVLGAFDGSVRTRPGAAAAVEAADVPVGVLSNCSVRSLAGRVLERSTLDPADFDAVVTSAGCGWRKPDPRAFEAVAAELGVEVGALLHVGDDPRTDGGADAAGARSRLVDEVPLAEMAGVLRDRTAGADDAEGTREGGWT